MDEESVTEVLLQDRLALTAFLRSLVRDRHVAEDLFQEVCIRAIRDRDHFRSPRHVLRWCRRAGRHRAIDHLRKHQNRESLLGDEVIELLAAADEPVAEPSHRVEALEQCLATLTPRSREVIALRYGQDLSGIEVADRLNRKVDAIYKNLARIYVHLRGCIERTLQSEAEPQTRSARQPLP